jgi:hypothetical protein
VNAVQVSESVSVPTKFARVLGIDSFDVTVRATACSPCASRPLDVMLVLDRTLSMCQHHNGTFDYACSDLTNAKNGLKTFLGFMDPSLDKVGLAVFPPATSTSNRCSYPATPDVVDGSNPPRYTDSNYSSSSYPYVLAQLATNYKTSSGSLNSSSTLVDTINCVKANGVTSYATALEKAQAELDARGRSNVQDVIVFFSDGAANYGPTYYSTTSPYRRQPCHQGVTSAAAIKARGTLIYTIGYDVGAENDPDGAQICQSYTGYDESPFISAISALRQIASSPEAFYNQPNPGELNTIYTKIAGEISGAKLVDNDLS